MSAAPLVFHELELTTHDDPAHDGKSWAGGLPPIAPGEWPRDHDGRPMTHLVTLPGDCCGRPEIAAFVIFAPTEDDAELAYAEMEEPVPVLVLDRLAEPCPAPEGARVLERHALRMRPMATIRVEASGDAFVAIREIEGKRFQSEGDSEAAALESAIEDLFIGGSVGSYCGGCAYYPSRMSMDAEADRAEEAEQRGRFVAQIEGGLFDDEDLDFCGGGWLFAYDRGGWFEQ